MAVSYTVTQFLNSVKNRILVPDNQSVFSDTDILRFANEEMELKIVPNMLRVKEEFYVITEFIPIQDGVRKYEIPARAVGSKVREVYRSPSLDTYEKVPMTRVQPEQVYSYNYDNYIEGYNAFYLEGNFIVLVGEAGSGGDYIGISYYLRPNDLVEESRVGIITAIDRTTGVITISNTAFPSNFTTNSKVDFLQASPNFRTYDFDITITNVNPTTKRITVAPADIPADLLVGDHIASAGECIIPQMPVEIRSMLAQSVACRMLEALGDLNNLDRAEKKLAEMQNMLFSVLDTRTEGNPQKINNLNSLLRAGKVRKLSSGY